ncbi:MAG: hypothetical protein IPP77_12435 [Bacteroidetes bacterium]|nr:hypothetical protein [Bacteroidota bacterium]
MKTRALISVFLLGIVILKAQGLEEDGASQIVQQVYVPSINTTYYSACNIMQQCPTRTSLISTGVFLNDGQAGIASTPC